MATKLFVGNLSFNTAESELAEMFKQAGTVVSCEIVMDKFTGKSRGFGFVQMSTQEEANKAVEQFHGQNLDGRALTVNEARPREERPRGGGASSAGPRLPAGHRGRRHRAADWPARPGPAAASRLAMAPQPGQPESPPA